MIIASVILLGSMSSLRCVHYILHRLSHHCHLILKIKDDSRGGQFKFFKYQVKHAKLRMGEEELWVRLFKVLHDVEFRMKEKDKLIEITSCCAKKVLIEAYNHFLNIL